MEAKVESVKRWEFKHLVSVARYQLAGCWWLNLVHEWDQKRTILLVQIDDVLRQEDAVRNAARRPHPTNPLAYFEDSTPAIRLAALCEAMCNNAYATGEIAACVLHHATNRVTPKSFNAVRKAVTKGTLGTSITNALGDLSWYAKLREIRTECTHYSTLFVGRDQSGKPVLVVKALRSKDDKQQFTEQAEFGCAEIAHWARAAVAGLDALAAYVGRDLIVPRLPLEQLVRTTVPDEFGMPQQHPDGLCYTREVPLRQLLQESGVPV